MTKKLLSQFGKALCVFFVIATVVFGVLVVTGQFQIDQPHDDGIGVYNSASAGLPAYYNPGLAAIAEIETISLLFLPVVLLIARRYIKALKGVSTIPWWTLLAGLLLYAIWSFLRPDYGFDLMTQSILPNVVYGQIPLTAGLMLGYGLLAWKLKSKTTGTAA